MNLLFASCVLLMVVFVEKSSAGGCDQDTFKAFVEKLVQIPTNTKLCAKG